MLTVDDCKNIIKKLGHKYSVDPALISTRLLSADDKKDMLSGHLSLDALFSAVEAWKNSGMPDYANGKITPYK